MDDPTYVKDEIQNNPIWKLAWTLSEVCNDNAPIGWGRYIREADYLLRFYDMKLKKKPNLLKDRSAKKSKKGF